MITLENKIVRDAAGNPREVIIPWEEYRKIVEILGLDLDEDAIADLNAARKDRETGNNNAYADLNSI